MKISTEWLQEYLATKMSAGQMAEGIEAAGIELEQLIDAKVFDSKIVIGLVKKVMQHPNADRLKLAEVDSGKGLVELVCGAPNLKVGQKVALAQVGSVLPDGTLIEKATIRGRLSYGMICSAKELGLSDDHAGIIELEADFKVGTKLCDVVENSSIVDIKTHANRPDLQSVMGVAREIAAVSSVALKEPVIAQWPVSGKGPEVQNLVSSVATRYVVGDLVVGIEKSTPEWMRERLKASGVRPINIIVDITNYVMLELGQPLHAFDASKVKLPIIVRMAEKGEKLVTLDGVERKLAVEDLVIADARGGIALAGVMGGLDTSVTADTKRILIESATFDGSTIRRMAQRHGLRTEASGRFERRLPVQLAPLAIKRTAALLIELAGAKPSGGLTDQLEVWPWVQHIGARSSRLTKLFGAELTRKTIAENLQKLGFEAELFDVAGEARKHLGKPYVWGASFKQNGSTAFDCSYLVDYIYSLIGAMIGHTALGQFELGKPVHTGELKPGDVVFYEGKIEKSATDHFYTLEDDNKTHIKHELTKEKRVGHNGIYIGDDRVVMAAKYGYENGFWTPLKKAEVVEVPLKIFTENPSYLGARRYLDNLEDYVAITVPWWRPDVKTEEDVLEEVARMVGYDNLKPTLPAWQPTVIETDKRWPKIWQIKAAMRGLGLFEVMTYSFISGQQLDNFGHDRSKHLKLRNPMSVEQEYLRSDLLASLAGAVARNVTYDKEFGLFEISKVFISKGVTKLPDEPMRLGVITRKQKDGYGGAKAALDLLGRELHIDFQIKPKSLKSLQPARSAEVLVDKKVIGMIGEVHPDNLRYYKISGSLGYLELDVGQLIGSASTPKYRPISKFPSIVRDLSLEVKDSVMWSEVKEVIDGSRMARSQYLSDYYGAELPAGKKGMAVRLEMNSLEKTLTDEEANKRVAQILKKLAQSLGAKLRGE